MQCTPIAVPPSQPSVFSAFLNAWRKQASRTPNLRSCKAGRASASKALSWMCVNQASIPILCIIMCAPGMYFLAVCHALWHHEVWNGQGEFQIGLEVMEEGVGGESGSWWCWHMPESLFYLFFQPPFFLLILPPAMELARSREAHGHRGEGLPQRNHLITFSLLLQCASWVHRCQWQRIWLNICDIPLNTLYFSRSLKDQS